MPRKYALPCAALLCLTLLAACAVFAKRYRVREIGALPGMTHSLVTEVNNLGEAVGASFSATSMFRAYLWRNGKMTDLGSLGGTYSAARAINDRRQIVGESRLVGDTDQHAFLWENGNMTDLGTLGGAQSEAHAINTQGQIVGWSWDAAIALPKAVLWEDGTIKALSVPPEVEVSFATGINDRGEISGTASRDGRGEAVIWRNGQMQFLGTLGGGSSFANAINGSGHVVGWTITATGEQRAFLWQNGTMSDLGVLPGGTSCVALAISDRGEVAVTCQVEGRDRAALWRDGALLDLSDMVPERWAPVTGVPLGVNLLGEVVVTTADDTALLLIPVGVPRGGVMRP